MPKVIRCPIHGYIKITADDQKLIDTGIFQRLKRIKHLPAEIVYPGATHTRFEHSLGVMALGDFIFKRLLEKGCLDKGFSQYRNTVRYACLLHDLGHTPLSHVCEKFGDKISDLQREIQAQGITLTLPNVKTKPAHEWTSCTIALSYFKQELKRLNVDLELFCRMITGLRYESEGKQKLNPLIDILDSWADADKLDYILRDSYETGAELVAIDKDRIIDSFVVKGDRLVISRAGLSVIPQLVHGRETLYLWVYTHHAVAYYHDLFQRYIQHLISEEPGIKKTFGWRQLADGADDIELHYLLRKHKDDDELTKILYKQIYEREGLYRSPWKNPFEWIEFFPDTYLRQQIYDFAKKGSLEQMLADNLGINKLAVFTFTASFKPFSEEKGEELWLDMSGNLKKFSEVFHESTFTKRPEAYSEIPYIRIDPEFWKTESNQNRFKAYLNSL